jgi:hypothetical protein
MAFSNFDALSKLANEFPKCHDYFEKGYLAQLDSQLAVLEIALPSTEARMKAKTVLASWYVHRCLDMIVAAEYVPRERRQDAYEGLALLIAPLLTPETGFPDFLDEFGKIREIQDARERFVWLAASALFPSGGGLAVAYPMLIVTAVDFEYICACRTAEAFGDEKTKLKNEEQRQKWFTALNKANAEKHQAPQSQAAQQVNLDDEREKAVNILLAKIPVDLLFEAYKTATQESQPPSGSFSFGMGVRNILRQEGTRLGDAELDDGWYCLIMEAARRAALRGLFSHIGRTSPPTVEEDYLVLEAIVRFEVEQGAQANVNPLRFQDASEKATQHACHNLPDESPTPIVCFVSFSSSIEPTDPPPAFLSLFTGEDAVIRPGSRAINRTNQPVTDQASGELGMLLALNPTVKWITDDSARANAYLRFKPLDGNWQEIGFGYFLRKRSNRWLVDERSISYTWG